MSSIDAAIAAFSQAVTNVCNRGAYDEVAARSRPCLWHLILGAILNAMIEGEKSME